jgi:general secretion pathway protein E
VPTAEARRKTLHIGEALSELTPDEALSIKGVKRSADVEWMYTIAEVMGQLPPKDQPAEAVRILDSNGRSSEVLTGTTDGPNALRMLLQLASKSRATDVHVEPKGEHFQTRLRVDGDMVHIVDLTKRVGELLFGVVKAACNMHVAGRDAVQDGHFSCVFPDRQVEYRISFTPSMYGQKLVIRVLDQRANPTSMLELGMASYMYERVRQVCSQDSGLLLVCGPTGSGKTTTLYCCIREIDRQTHNVVTIEDPVEYTLDNTTQIPIDERQGNTFGTLLRSVLRQDPDVILVGEIRDEETARTAMQAALTGHMVFSSIHAKETISAVFRLLDLKVEPYLVANAMQLILAQRLVRVLCEHCKRQMPITPSQATRVGKHLGGKTQIYVATGCARCLRTGYRGRRALFELLDVNDELRDIVLREPSITAMKKVIEQGLFTTLQTFGWRLVAEGVTSLDEVDRVAGMS